MATGTEARVIALIEERQQKGLAKYGTSVTENPLPLRAWLQHQLEELLDASIYCQRAIEEIDRGRDASCDPAAQWRNEGFNEWRDKRYDR